MIHSLWCCASNPHTSSSLWTKTHNTAKSQLFFKENDHISTQSLGQTDRWFHFITKKLCCCVGCISSSKIDPTWPHMEHLLPLCSLNICCPIKNTMCHGQCALDFWLTKIKVHSKFLTWNMHQGQACNDLPPIIQTPTSLHGISSPSQLISLL